MRFPFSRTAAVLPLGLALVVAWSGGRAWAQPAPQPLTVSERRQVTELLGQELRKHWVIPEIGKKLEGTLLGKLRAGAYDAIQDPAAFGTAITKDVVAITQDRHFHLFFAPERAKAERAAPDSAAAKAARDQELKEDQEFNFGFQDVRILGGNVGYIRLDGFSALADAADTASAAMALVRHTDALILDLRRNHGGYTDTLQFLASYGFDGDPTLLFTEHAHEGATEVLTQYSTLPYLPGTRRAKRPLYILTSAYTFSAAEALPYFLQHRKKAVVVGEVTGGGAHIWTGYPVGDRFYAHIPTSRSLDPITNTDWEGVGVKPDLEVPAGQALTTAHLKALESLAASTTDNQRFRWAIPAVQAQQRPPLDLDVATLRRLSGTYGEIVLGVKAGQLVYEGPARQHLELRPLEPGVFSCDGVPDVRIKLKATNGAVEEMVILYANGDSRTYPRKK
jgi:hypothetical protein